MVEKNYDLLDNIEVLDEVGSLQRGLVLMHDYLESRIVFDEETVLGTLWKISGVTDHLEPEDTDKFFDEVETWTIGDYNIASVEPIETIGGYVVDVAVRFEKAGN